MHLRAVPRRRPGPPEAMIPLQLTRATPHTLKVKVCCIASIEEAELALSAGADVLGLVSAMPSGPGVIADDAIARIARWVGSRAATVLLTSRTTAREIGAQLDECTPAIVQLTDSLADEELEQLRARHPEVAIMPV